MAHVGEKVALQLGRALQEIGLVIEFCVQGDYAAIRFIEFFVQLRQFILTVAQLIAECASILCSAAPVLRRDFCEACVRCCPTALFRSRRNQLSESWKERFLAERDDGVLCPSRSRYLKVIHQALGADHAKAHASLGDVFPVQNCVDCRCPAAGRECEISKFSRRAVIEFKISTSRRRHIEK